VSNMSIYRGYSKGRYIKIDSSQTLQLSRIVARPAMKRSHN